MPHPQSCTEILIYLEKSSDLNSDFTSTIICPWDLGNKLHSMYVFMHLKRDWLVFILTLYGQLRSSLLIFLLDKQTLYYAFQII